MVGGAARVHHDLCPLLPGQQLCAGYGAEEAADVPDHGMEPCCVAFDYPDPAGDYLIITMDTLKEIDQ